MLHAYVILILVFYCINFAACVRLMLKEIEKQEPDAPPGQNLALNNLTGKAGIILLMIIFGVIALFVG